MFPLCFPPKRLTLIWNLIGTKPVKRPVLVSIVDNHTNIITVAVPRSVTRIGKLKIREGEKKTDGYADLNEFIKWVLEDPKNRSVNIEIARNNLSDGSESLDVRVFAHDFRFINESGSCQFVRSAAEIDIEAQVAKFKFQKYQKLKKEFELDSGVF